MNRVLFAGYCRPINSRESSPADDNDLSRGSQGLSALSALSAAYTPKEKKRKLELTERRRSKLRDIEVSDWLVAMVTINTTVNLIVFFVGRKFRGDKNAN